MYLLIVSSIWSLNATQAEFTVLSWKMSSKSIFFGSSPSPSMSPFLQSKTISVVALNFEEVVN